MATLLPGGPEDDSLGARGSIWKIPGDFEVFEVASGFLGATNLAVGRPGYLYVTELFGNRVSELHNGVITPVINLPAPAGLEYDAGDLVVSYDVFGDGKVGRFTP
jgi:hypothetical protein